MNANLISALSALAGAVIGGNLHLINGGISGAM
jgi:hypothetical protein